MIKALLVGMDYPDFVMADGPAAFWPMQESSGDLQDVTGNGHTGTKVGSGGVTYAASGPGPHNAIEFAGSSGVGYSAADANVWSSGSFTAEAWIYLDSSFFSGQYARYFIAKHYATTTHEWFAMVEDTGGGRLTAQVNNWSDTNYRNKLLASWGPPTTTWKHVVMVYTGGGVNTVTLYVDGTAVVSAGTTSGSRQPNGAGVLSIGHSPAVASRSWKGRLSMVAFYDYALTADKVAIHYGAMQ